MSSLTTTKLPQLPAHLMALAGTSSALMALNAAATSGISSGGHPRISIKGSRFRLQSVQGEEVVVPTLDLDVIIVGANPHGVSKVYYKGAYDPSVEDKGPDCYSDNGAAPSFRATAPQSNSCATCPHNAWGSKILPSGKQGKACADVKKVAVLVANNPDGPVFELRIPAASLSNYAKYVDSLTKRGMPAAMVVTKLKFDTDADYPKLVFDAVGWATAEQAEAVLSVVDTDEVDQCTGKNDKPIERTVAIAAPAQAPAMPPIVAAAPLPPAVTAPVVTAPAASTPSVMAAPPAEPAKRPARRTRAAEPELPLTMAAPPASSLPPFLANIPPSTNAANIAAPLAPAGVTSAALDDMIAQAMAT